MVKTKGWGLTKARGGSYANSLGEMNSYVQMIEEDRGMGTLERHRTRMSQCFLSQEALREPVVACKLGNLYNKEAMIGALLNKSIPPAMSHIKKLSDVKNCLVSWKEAEQEKGKKRMVCPVTREDLDTGGSRAVVIWSTGAIVGAKSLKELKAKDCPVTGKQFDADKDLIPLAPDGEELAKLRERLPAASKKRKAEENAPAAVQNEAEKGSTTATTAKEYAKEGAEAAKKKIKDGTSTYKALFTEDRAEGLTGPRDAFGCPVYNRGSRCI
jgi:hypothetical protein